MTMRTDYAILRGAKSTSTMSDHNDVIGYVESIDQELVVHGWATNTDYAEGLAIKIFARDALLCSTLCNIYRPDIIGPNGRALRCGFRAPLPAGSLKHLITDIRIEAVGKELEGSPVSINLSTRIGLEIVGIKAASVMVRIAGWMGAAITGILKIDGIPVAFPEIASSPSDFERNPEALVSVSIPSEFQDGRIHAFSFEIDQGNAVVRSDVHLLQYPEYKFHIDQASSHDVTGWAIRTDRRSPLLVEAIYKGEKIAGGLTNLRRFDVSSSLDLQSHDQVGFFLSFNRIIPADGGSIYLRDAETGIDFAKFSQIENYAAALGLANAIKKFPVGVDNASLELMRGLVSAIGPGLTTCFTPLSLDHDPENSDGRVAVVIPVYNGAVEVAECLESVLNAKNVTPFDLILVNDRSPDVNIVNYLRTLERRSIPNLRIFHRLTNAGFSAAVNLGMLVAGSNDVILLNADTVVQDGWLDRIVTAAKSDPTIGTVTPFSNNGEICSVPYMCKSLPVNTEQLATKIDRAAAGQNHDSVIDLPVAIGFCMFIRRACLNEVGFFDAEKWGRGYGEEVDFCLKAAALGWRNVLAGDVFIVHRGAVSFGNEKLERIIESARKINESYPFYDDAIQRFLQKDPLRVPRRRINQAILRESLPRPRILHVTHGMGGGTQRYVDDLSALYRKDGGCNTVISFDKYQRCEMRFDGASIAYPDFFMPDHVEAYDAEDSGALLDDIRDFEFDVVHLHSPIGVPPTVLERICETHEYLVTIHDYAWICPRVTLTTSFGKYYGDEPENPAFISDVIRNPMPGLQKYVELAMGDIAKYRAYFADVLNKAKLVIVGGDDVAKRLRRYGIDAAFRSAPHPKGKFAEPHIKARTPAPPHTGDPIRVALFGGISDIKGFGTLLQCAEYAQEEKLPIEFIVFGYTRDDSQLAPYANVRVLGRYREDDIGNLIVQYQPHLAFFPNRWPETFSYTLSIAIDWNIWPVVADIGVPAERVTKAGFGSILPIDTSAAEYCMFLLNAYHEKEWFRENPFPDIRTQEITNYIGG